MHEHNLSHRVKNGTSKEELPRAREAPPQVSAREGRDVRPLQGEQPRPGRAVLPVRLPGVQPRGEEGRDE